MRVPSRGDGEASLAAHKAKRDVLKGGLEEVLVLLFGLWEAFQSKSNHTGVHSRMGRANAKATQSGEIDS